MTLLMIVMKIMMMIMFVVVTMDVMVVLLFMVVVPYSYDFYRSTIMPVGYGIATVAAVLK